MFSMELLPVILSASSTALSLSVLIMCLALCWYYYKSVKAFWNFPSKRLEYWLLNFIIGRHPTSATFTSVFFQEIIKQCKRFQKEGYCVIWLIRPYLVIYNEEFSKILFNEEAVADKLNLYENLRPGLGNGLLLSEGKLWKEHRKLINPVFHLRVLKSKLHIFNENAADLGDKLERIAGKPTTELLDFLKFCSFNALTESVLGFKLKDDEYGSKTAKYLELVHRGTVDFVYRITSPWLYSNTLLPLFSWGRKHLEGCAEFHELTQELITEMKKSVLSCKVQPDDSNVVDESKISLAQVLLERHMTDPEFTTEDVRDQISTIAAAGHDTTAHALSFCLHMLGMYPEVQEKAFKEVDSVVMGGDVTYDHICKMKYLDSVIKETLRLYAVIPMYGRVLKKDIRYGEKVVPKGTEVTFFPYLLHRNPSIYTEPEKFKPERFYENSEIRPWNYIPFAEGYRNCIGKKYAMMQIKVFLAHVLRRFEIKTLDKIEESDLDWNIVLLTQNPVRMQFSPRHSSLDREE